MDTLGRSYVNQLHQNIEAMRNLMFYWGEKEDEAEAAGDDASLDYATFKWDEAHKSWYALCKQLEEYNKYHS